MTEPSHNCTDETCSATRTTPLLGSIPQATTTLTIDIVSDVICPWCWIGKRRLEKALKLVGNPPEVKGTWKPFQMNPQMQPQGIERRVYRTKKFGSWEKS